MPKRVVSCVATVASLWTVMALSINWALASGGCVVQPNRQLADGGHWRYHVDRVNHRRCWYLAESRTKLPQAEAPEAAPSSDAATFPFVSSFLSSLSADLMGTKPAGLQQDSTNGDARRLQVRPTARNNSDTSRVKRFRIGRHLHSSKAMEAKLNRQWHAEPRVEGGNQPPPLSEAERANLLHEFLQWNARQTP
jgi:hypothetical protein